MISVHGMPVVYAYMCNGSTMFTMLSVCDSTTCMFTMLSVCEGTTCMFTMVVVLDFHCVYFYVDFTHN